MDLLRDWKCRTLFQFFSNASTDTDFVVGGIGLALEKHAGQIAPQGWEFYAITGTMFVTLAFPGFVYRYLLHRRD